VGSNPTPSSNCFTKRKRKEMSAEVETMMYVGDVPWHGLGFYCGDKPVTSKEAIVAAGLDWRVEKSPLYIMGEEEYVEGTVRTVPIPVEDNVAIVRSTDKSILGVVGNRYEPVQNTEAFSFMDGLVESGQMRYHTAGSLRNGQRVWLLGKVGQYEVVDGDQMDEYLFLYNSHDGSRALRCLFTTVRVVCANTARLALAGKESEGITLRHTSKIQSHLTEAQEVLARGNANFAEFRKFTAVASKMQFDGLKLKKFGEIMFPEPPKSIRINKKGDEVEKKFFSVEKARNEVYRLFEEGRGNQLLNVKGTGWAAYNAATEYANYFKAAKGTTKQERRFENVMFGTSALLIDRAQDTIYQMARAA
jgi:phage/plasmid-like protein (TIGR03299 family)